MEKITVIDVNLIPENLTINDLLAIIKIHNKGELDFSDEGVDYKKLQKEKFIKIITDEENTTYILRQKGLDLLDAVIGKEVAHKEAPVKKKTNVDLFTRIPEFRAKWKGLKPGSMGSAQSCKTKLTRWMQENPEYTFEDILIAADNYIESLNGDYRFLQRADYFIYKQENNREESSRLSAHIDEISINGAQQGDWTTKLN